MEINTTIPTSLPSLDTAKPRGSAPEKASPAGNKSQALDQAVGKEADKVNGNKSPVAPPKGPEVHLELRIDEGTGQVYGRVVDTDTGDAVREIPAEDLRRLAAQFRHLIGDLLDKTV